MIVIMYYKLRVKKTPLNCGAIEVYEVLTVD